MSKTRFHHLKRHGYDLTVDSPHDAVPLPELVGGQRLCETCLQPCGQDDGGNPTEPTQWDLSHTWKLK